ncbi:Hypothetical predicted protein, partial [Pelobates cultripes]
VVFNTKQTTQSIPLSAGYLLEVLRNRRTYNPHLVGMPNHTTHMGKFRETTPDPKGGEYSQNASHISLSPISQGYYQGSQTNNGHDTTSSQEPIGPGVETGNMYYIHLTQNQGPPILLV